MLGEFLKGRRKAAGLSQPKLAKITGISQTYISRIERGEVGLPQKATREKFHRALGTTERDWLDAAGSFDTEEDQIAPAPPPRPHRLPDSAWDRRAIIEYVEAYPDPDAHERLMRERERRGGESESYYRFCLRTFRLWHANFNGVLETAEEFRGELWDSERTGEDAKPTDSQDTDTPIGK